MWDSPTSEERATIRLNDGEQSVSLSLGLQDLQKVCETLLLALQTTEQQYCFPEQLMEVRLSCKYWPVRNEARSISPSLEILYPACPGWLKPTVSIIIK